ncbi:MAG: hypothetical protein AAGK32_00690 [Actinomycetota bacterium]
MSTTRKTNSNTTVRTMAGAAIATLVAALTLTLVAPAAAHAVSATAGVNPSTAAAGEMITVSGSGFEPFENIDVWYGGPVIGSGQADANGDFSIPAVVPDSMPEGEHPMDVSGDQNSMVSLDYEVVAAPTPPPGGGSGTTPTPPAPPAPTPTPTPTPAPVTKTTPVGNIGDATEQAADDTVGDEVDTAGIGDGDSLDTEIGAWLLAIGLLGAAGLAICIVASRRREEDPAS